MLVAITIDLPHLGRQPPLQQLLSLRTTAPQALMLALRPMLWQEHLRILLLDLHLALRDHHLPACHLHGLPVLLRALPTLARRQTMLVRLINLLPVSRLLTCSILDLHLPSRGPHHRPQPSRTPLSRRMLRPLRLGPRRIQPRLWQKQMSAQLRLARRPTGRTQWRTWKAKQRQSTPRTPKSASPWRSQVHLRRAVHPDPRPVVVPRLQTSSERTYTRRNDVHKKVVCIPFQVGHDGRCRICEFCIFLSGSLAADWRSPCLSSTVVKNAPIRSVQKQSRATGHKRTRSVQASQQTPVGTGWVPSICPSKLSTSPRIHSVKNCTRRRRNAISNLGPARSEWQS